MIDNIQDKVDFFKPLEQDQNHAETLAVSLHHTDAVLTQYELNSGTQNLNEITDALEENCDHLEDLKTRIENHGTAHDEKSQRILKLKTRLIYLTNLYANLLTRLHALRSVCDHSIQVIYFRKKNTFFFIFIKQ